MGSTPQFTELLQEGVPRLNPASYVTSGSHNVGAKVRTHGRSPTSSFLLCSLFNDALDLPSQAYLDWELEAAASRYRSLFTAFEIQPQDVLLRLPNRRLYIGPHAQEYLVGLDSEWEEHLTRWVLAVPNALRTDAALPPFPAAGVATPEGEPPALESDPQVRGQMEPGGTAGRATENLQIAGGRDFTPPGRLGVPLKQPSAASATRSDRAYAYWRGRGGAGYKKQARSTARIWEGVTSEQFWERGRHEPGANLLAWGARAATGPWPEEGQRWGHRT